jgi:hypothetical protein
MAENVPERESPPARASVGSVAEETARLVEALLAGTGAPGQDEASGPADRTDASDQSGTEQSGEEKTAAEPCPTCGHVPGTGHDPQNGDVCRLCPVCQLLRVVRTVRPETLDQLADLAAAVTETLREVAATRWRESGSAPPRRPRPEVEDIHVDGEAGR